MASTSALRGNSNAGRIANATTTLYSNNQAFMAIRKNPKTLSSKTLTFIHLPSECTDMISSLSLGNKEIFGIFQGNCSRHGEGKLVQHCQNPSFYMRISSVQHILYGSSLSLFPCSRWRKIGRGRSWVSIHMGWLHAFLDGARIYRKRLSTQRWGAFIPFSLDVSFVFCFDALILPFLFLGLAWNCSWRILRSYWRMRLWGSRGIHLLFHRKTHSFGNLMKLFE